MGSNGKIFQLIDVKDSVVELKFGEIGFILTRKIVLSIFLALLILLTAVYKIKTFDPRSMRLHNHESDEYCNLFFYLSDGVTDVTWP